MTVKRDISNVAPTTNGITNGHLNGENGAVETLDMLIVGGGFAGVFLVQRLRERGFNAKIVEVSANLRNDPPSWVQD